MLVYKITNIKNGKIYIGITTCSLKYRWSRHVTEAKIGNNKPLYKAIRKYGSDNFKIDVLEETDDFEKLGMLERYYISYFDSTNLDVGYNLSPGGEKNRWDANPSSKLKLDQVIEIRKHYSEGILSCKECWLKYFPEMSYSGFQKVWDGTSWKGIMDDIYTPENIALHARQKTSFGEKNPNAIYSDTEVMCIRNYYSSHTLKETYAKFGRRSSSLVSFRQVIDRNYSHLPVYSKVRKRWELNGKEIDIDSYNPVSTILVSEE